MFNDIRRGTSSRFIAEGKAIQCRCRGSYRIVLYLMLSKYHVNVSRVWR
jgi:hypothetical protein